MTVQKKNSMLSNSFNEQCNVVYMNISINILTAYCVPIIMLRAWNTKMHSRVREATRKVRATVKIGVSFCSSQDQLSNS